MRDKNEILHVEGAKAGSKQKQPYRAAVTSTTNQKMRITYGLSEGEIAGFNALGNFTETDMLKRIFLDGTPIMSEEGTRLLDVKVEFRSGTQDQSVISGLPSVTIENSVNVEVKLNAPVSRSFTRTETTSFDVRVSVPQLWDGDAEGNSRKGTIQFRIEVSVNNGPFDVAGTFTVNEKIISGWSQTYNVPATKGSAHTIRIVRMNSEQVNEFSANKLIVDSIVEVTDVRLRYPRTALLYLEYNADQFSNIPKLEVQMFGKADILVPANYNPIRRVYSTTGVGTSNGVWDGTFKRAYTDNPVWIWLDLITSKRYGTGNRITIDMVDKWELYGLSRYCDQLVPDGKGGQEPRFTCNNLYLQKSEDAFKVLKDLTAMFRSKTVWDGTKIRAVADVPRTPALAFTSSNCKDIVYSSVDTSAQHNLVNVQYYDKTNRFASKIEMRRDARNIVQRDRVVEMNFTALGCTSAGQAQRIAQYILVSELNEQNIVSFTTGLEGSIPKLNDVFYFADEYVAGRVIGGRVVSITGKSVKLDREVPLAVGKVADPNVQLILNRDDGTTAPIRITSVAQDKRTVYLQFAPPASVGPELQWTLITPQVMPQMFYITDIEYNDKDKTYNISGMQYLESKYGAIDGDARIVAPPISINENSMLKAPATLSARYFVKIVQDISVCDIEVSWAQSANATKYQLEMRKDNGEWRIVGSYTSLTAELENMYTGIYEFRITAYDTLNNASQYTYSSPLNVQGKVLPPPALSVYAVQGILLGFQHNWVYPAHTEDSRGVRIRRALQDPAIVGGQNYEVVDVAYPSNSYTQNNVPSNTTAWFSAAIVDKYGVIGAYTDWVKASVNDDPDQIMDLIEGSVALKDLDEELRKDLTDTKDLASTANQNAERAKAAANAAKIAADDAAAQAGQNAIDISNEAAARIAADKVESDARIAAVATLQDGLNTETQQRKDAVSSLTQTVTNNKASTDASIANVQNQVTSQASTLASQASQLSSLDARTTTAETNIANVTQKADAAVAQGQSNATAITTLQGNINTINGQLANKAETSAVDTLSQKVTANEGNISTHTQQLASLTNSVTTLQGDISKKADAGALTTLEGRVSANEGAISSQSGQLTNLSNSITTLNGQVANKADAQAVTNLENRVKLTEDGLTSLSNATTQLSNSITTINGQLATKADSGALSTLESRVATTENTLTSHGQAITQVQATADLALNGKTYWIDMTGHDPNLYYPVLIPVSEGVGNAEIAIDIPLYTSNAPWASHRSGTFALNIRWIVKGSGWGANPIEREITKFGWGWTQNGQSPAMNINQEVERSCEYIYLRGGTKYKFTCNQYAQAPFMESSYQGVVYAPSRVPKSIGATTSANASAITTLDAKVDVVDGKAQSAANATTLLRTDVDGHTSALQLNAQSINGIESKYTVKIDNNGYISGYGLISTTNNGIPTSAFTVNADFFSVGKVGDSTSYKPFVVVNSSNQVIDGETYPEVGVYMRQAFMSKLSVTTAHIKDLSVTTAKIDNLAVGTAQIKDLAVDSSKIKDLAVDTLKIADNAVTVPLYLADYSAPSSTNVPIGEFGISLATIQLIGINQGQKVVAFINAVPTPNSISLQIGATSKDIYGTLELAVFEGSNKVQTIATASMTTETRMVWNSGSDGGGGYYMPAEVKVPASIQLLAQATPVMFTASSTNPSLSVRVIARRREATISKIAGAAWTVIGVKK